MKKTTSQISKTQVQYVAKLAKFKISDSELKKYQKDFSSILNYMQEISKLNLKKIPKTFSSTEEVNIFRKDEVGKSFDQGEALKNARSTHEGFFVVPYVLEKN